MACINETEHTDTFIFKWNKQHLPLHPGGRVVSLYVI